MSNQPPLAIIEEDGGQIQRKRHTYKKRNSHLVVGKVHAKWCGHCEALVPEWSKMKAILKKKKHGIQYVEIEEKHKEKGLAEVKQKYGVDVEVKGYPVVFKIENGKLDYYEGQRTAEQMADWYVNGGNSKKDHYGFFRGGFKSLHDMKQSYSKKTKSYSKKTRTQRKTIRGTMRRLRGFFGL